MPRAPGPSRVVTALAEVIRLPLKRLQDGSSTAKLDEIQQQALSLLVDGQTMESAAASVGVEESTVLQWVSFDAGFKAALLAAQQRRRTIIQLGIERAAEKATEVLYSILTDEKTRPDVKLKAVGVALERLRDVSGEPPRADKSDDDPIGKTLSRMGAAIPPGASAAIGVRKGSDGTIMPLDPEEK